MFGVPNINERADMIGRYFIFFIIEMYRALAKETDGDFAKFV